jgi:hypothetical protein
MVPVTLLPIAGRLPRCINRKFTIQSKSLDKPLFEVYLTNQLYNHEVFYDQ